MTIRKYLQLFLCFISFNSVAQSQEKSTLDLGDPAPPLRVGEWLKGDPIQQLEKGHIYVIEFWATWCGPCIAAMPHLSKLAAEYKDKVTIIGVDIYKEESTPIGKIKAFVDSMGSRMDYHVAIDDSSHMVEEWIVAFDEKKNGIPRTFVVNADGQMAWIGYPKDLDTVLQKIVNNDWHISESQKNRNEEEYFQKLQMETIYFLNQYMNEPNLLLSKVDSLLKKEPRLKHAPYIPVYIFSALLKIDQKQAYEYGKNILTEPDKDLADVSYFFIRAIQFRAETSSLVPEIYALGADAYEKYRNADNVKISNLSKYYNDMASWYWLANNKPKAIETQQKSIEALKAKRNLLLKT
ncbi:TlpA family protein disulfide reductase [Sphingobacterium sp. xlx-130]|uniref:TlpA family protein disulfide reductase n=1 Tax=Sphingobacterium sp. xlx-130 TaxID=2654323 RepID=UPI0013DA8497|nr:TlpA disulfide reductase family protein [Sphingobacterium sp. xlx-130]